MILVGYRLADFLKRAAGN